MGNNKKTGKKRVKKEIVYRTKKERQEQVKTILKQLSELELTIAYEPIKLLYAILKKYIDEGARLKINIPFPEAFVPAETATSLKYPLPKLYLL